MIETYIISWNETDVGEISDISIDMWYLEGLWHSYENDVSRNFESKLATLDPKKFYSDATLALGVILSNTKNPLEKIYCAAISLNNDSIFVRRLLSEEGKEIFFPTEKDPSLTPKKDLVSRITLFVKKLFR